MKENLRRTQRQVLQIPVSEKGTVTNFNGTIINLSEGGLCYLRPFVAGEVRSQMVSLSFSSGNPKSSIDVIGKIVHELELEDLLLTGVEFQQLKEHDKETLQAQISHFSSRPPVYLSLFTEMSYDF